MTNTDTDTGSKRKRVSERSFIDSEGNEVERIEQATGARYKLVQNGKTFDVQLGNPGEAATMFAVFGAWTKIGNVANTVLNDKDEPGTPDDAAEEIEAFLANVDKGVWRELQEGAKRGPKYDKDVLAASLVEVLTAAGKVNGDVASYRERLDDASYYAKVRANTDVMAAYHAAMREKGAAGPSVDSLA